MLLKDRRLVSNIRPLTAIDAAVCLDTENTRRRSRRRRGRRERRVRRRRRKRRVRSRRRRRTTMKRSKKMSQKEGRGREEEVRLVERGVTRFWWLRGKEQGTEKLAGKEEYGKQENKNGTKETYEEKKTKRRLIRRREVGRGGGGKANEGGG